MRYILFLFSWICIAQQAVKVDFISAKAEISLNDTTKSVAGAIKYEFNVISTIDSIRIDAKNMEFESVFINQKKVSFKNSKKELVLFEGFKIGSNVLSIKYIAKPKQTLYFIGSKDENNLQIWTQGQGKYTSHWLPSFDDVNEKLVFEISIVFDANYKVVSNGILESFVKISPDFTQWNYKMKAPMSSYLLMLAVGKFDHKTEKSNSGAVLENYFEADDANKYATTYKHSKQIFDFLENEIGVKYPWEIYRQIPVRDFLYAGMENTTSTIFSQDFVVDETGFNDLNFINVSAHELAHHWFGNLITAKSGKHHWLQEGFATFYALLAERKLFGDDYFYLQMYANAQQIKKAAKTDTIPILSEKAGSLSFYQKGSLALFYMYDKIGAKQFQKIVKNYLKKYKYKNVETKDFLNEAKKVSNFDVVDFQKKWLEDYRFPAADVEKLFAKSAFVQELIEVQNKKKMPFAENEVYFSQKLQSNCYHPIKTEIIYQLKNVLFKSKENLIREAMKTNDLEVRQAVANSMEQIPASFKNDYEAFLDENSYVTKEIALSRLCNQFPENRLVYLEKAKNWMGNNDRNLRITYLFLSQLSENFDAVEKQKNLQELIEYTSAKYESSIRKNGFDAALQLRPIDDKVLENLVNATTHFKWQFSKFAREYLRGLLKTNGFRERFEVLKTSFSDENKLQLQKYLD